MLRFRLGMMLGFAIGYVLGAKAGRERYDRLQAAFATVTGSRPAQQLSTEVRDAASRAGTRLESKAAEQVSRVTSVVRRDGRTTGNGGATLPPD